MSKAVLHLSFGFSPQISPTHADGSHEISATSPVIIILVIVLLIVIITDIIIIIIKINVISRANTPVGMTVCLS